MIIQRKTHSYHQLEFLIESERALNPKTDYVFSNITILVNYELNYESMKQCKYEV